MLRIFTHYDVQILRVALIMYKIMYENYFPLVYDFIHEPDITHDHETRQAGDVRLPFPRIEILRSNFHYRFIQIWNLVPINIKNSPSLSIFKRRYIDFLFNGY